MASLWTAWAEYGGTGEGQTMLVWVGYAESGVEAQNALGNRFGSFFTRLCNAEEGVVENAVTRHLIPAETFALLRKTAAKAHVEFYTHLHLNAA